MPLPITQLGSWEAGLLEGVVGATAEGEMAEAHQLAADLESFGFRVALRPRSLESVASSP